MRWRQQNTCIKITWELHLIPAPGQVPAVHVMNARRIYETAGKVVLLLVKICDMLPGRAMGLHCSESASKPRVKLTKGVVEAENIHRSKSSARPMLEEPTFPFYFCQKTSFYYITQTALDVTAVLLGQFLVCGDYTRVSP